MESIIASLITGGLALTGVILTNISSNKKIETKLMVAQGITDTKIDNLAEKVEKCTDYVDKVPKLEVRIDNIEKRLDKMEDDKR